MPLTLNTQEARKADQFSTVIRDTGKYTGVITRAQKLVSKKGTEGVGFSFKSDDGASANYLDVYTTKPDGSKLMGHAIVNAVLACTKLRDVSEGPIEFDAWDRDIREMVRTKAEGYPGLMGKRIGFVLQREIAVRQDTGDDQERLQIVAVFEPGTDFMASEILDQKTKPEKLARIVASVMANPLKDRRGKKQDSGSRAVDPAPHAAPIDTFDDSIPF